MAKTPSTKAAVLEETEEVTEAAEPTTKQIINDAIAQVVEATGIDVQKNRYKAMRAIAFQAFSDLIEAGEFEDTVERAIANVGDLPAGWEIEKAERVEVEAKPAKKAAAKPAAKAATATKTPAKRAPKAAAAKTEAAPKRRRPQR